MAGAAWESEGLQRLAHGRLPDAREAFVLALVRNPGAARARLSLQEVDSKLGTRAAPPLLREVEALCAEASRAAQSGNLTGAQRLLRRAVRQAPDHPRPWHLLSNVLFLLDEREEAATALERAVAANPYDRLLAANLAALRGLNP